MTHWLIERIIWLLCGVPLGWWLHSVVWKARCEAEAALARIALVEHHMADVEDELHGVESELHEGNNDDE